jgi:hypothetical protein
MTIREVSGQLVVDDTEVGYFDTDPLAFRSEDMAFASKPGHAPVWPAYRGMPVEFIRNQHSAVTWIRRDGRIARKQGG